MFSVRKIGVFKVSGHQQQAVTFIKNRIRKTMRFGIAFLGFWLHFGRLFEVKIHEKWIQKSDEIWHFHAG